MNSLLKKRRGVRLSGTIAAGLMLIVNGCKGYGDNFSGSPQNPSNLYWSVAVVDVNGDGKNDVVVSYTSATSATSQQGLVAVYLQNAAQPGSFLAPTTYSVDVSPVSLTVGDLNGDGKPDIAVVTQPASYSGASNVQVLLQETASPGHFLATTRYATGAFPNAVAIGDLNGDGKADIAVADSTGISVLFQSATPGTFSAPTTLALGAAETSVATADLNGDKAQVVAVSGYSVAVFLQNAAAPGTFGSATTYAAGLQPKWVGVADLDGDGNPDLAVANQGAPSGGSASVSVLLQNPAAPGTFLSARDYSTVHEATMVIISDVNGDGKPDLVVAAGDRVSIFLQDPSMAGQFQAALDYGVNFGVNAIAVGDVNGDGKPDLVIADSGGVWVRLQDAANPGTFLAAIQIAK